MYWEQNLTHCATKEVPARVFLTLVIPELRASLVAQLVKNPPAMPETLFDSWIGKIRWRRDRLPTPVFLGFPCGSAGKESARDDLGWINVVDLGWIPGLGRSPGEGKGYPLQYSGLENSMDCIVRGVAKSLTRLSEFHFHFQPSAHMNCWDSESCLTHSGLCLLIQGRLLLPRSQQVPDCDSA